MHSNTRDKELFIGIMSGNSLDGIDIVCVDFSNNQTQLVAQGIYPLSQKLRNNISTLYQPGFNNIHLLAQTDIELGHLFADNTNHFIKKNLLKTPHIIAIGSHGQTIRHQPDMPLPYTLQIGDPNIIAEKTGITTIADFRKRDIACLGQGAPLAPAFHDYLLPQRQQDYWVLNLGGIANLTFLPKDMTQPVIGFDCGPGNTLLDSHYQSLHKHSLYDKKGLWARSGQHCDKLLKSFIEDPFFSQSPPKSTGKEYFNVSWLNSHLKNKQLAANDIQASLTELTATSIFMAIEDFSHNAKTLYVCGGGAHNTYLIERMKNHSTLNIQSTEHLGVGPDWVEAAAFAWLAKQTFNRKSSNLSSVTGAKHPSILGGIWYARPQS